jgi:small subunit ribosomal protein S17
MASTIAKAVKPILPPLFHSQKVGVVVSAGKMAGAVKVRVAEHEWNKKFRKVSLLHLKILYHNPSRHVC